MGNYTGYIVATYGLSFVALTVLAVRSYLLVKSTEKAVVTLRQARKAQGE